MIKKNLCDVLKRLISTNIISVKTSRWIEQKKSSNQFDTEADGGPTFFINHHTSEIEFDHEQLWKFWSGPLSYILTPCFAVIFACKVGRSMKFWSRKGVFRNSESEKKFWKKKKVFQNLGFHKRFWGPADIGKKKGQVDHMKRRYGDTWLSAWPST